MRKPPTDTYTASGVLCVQNLSVSRFLSQYQERATCRD